MARGRGGRGGGRGVVKPVSHSQPALRIRTPHRTEIGGLNLVQLRMTQFQQAGPPEQAGPSGVVQQAPLPQDHQDLPDPDPVQHRQAVDLPEPM